MAIKHGDNARNVMCDAVVDLIDLGASVGKLRIINSLNGGTKYESGDVAAIIADTDTTPVSGAGSWGATDVIASLEFSAVAFKDAGLPNDDNSIKGRVGCAHANDVTEDQSCDGGPSGAQDADHFEIVDGDGNLILNGEVRVQGNAEADIALTSVRIATDDTIAIRNLSYTCAP